MSSPDALTAGTDPAGRLDRPAGSGPAHSLPAEHPRGGRRRSGAPVPGPPRLLRFLLPVSAAALIGWELAALAVVAAYPHRHAHYGLPVLITVAVLGGLVIALSSVRLAGLTGAERLVARRAFRRRGRAHSAAARAVAAPATDPAAGPAASTAPAADTAPARLLPGLTLNNHIDRAGNRTGVIGSGLGWSATIKIADSTAPDPEALLAAAARACLRPDLPLAAVQVLSWSLPASWNAAGAAVAGDRTLRQFFVAVRVAERPSARAILARGGGPAGAQRATASAAAALAFALTQLGYGCSVLDGTELEQHVQLLSGATYADLPRGAGDPGAKPSETRDSWSAGRLQQSCLRVGAGTSPAAALSWPVREPLSFVIGSCTITPDPRAVSGGRAAGGPVPGAVRRDFLMRAAMVGQPSTLNVEQAARSLDRRLVPLRYRQEPAVRATLPLALAPDGR